MKVLLITASLLLALGCTMERVAAACPASTSSGVMNVGSFDWIAPRFGTSCVDPSRPLKAMSSPECLSTLSFRIGGTQIESGPVHLTDIEREGLSAATSDDSATKVMRELYDRSLIRFQIGPLFTLPITSRPWIGRGVSLGLQLRISKRFDFIVSGEHSVISKDSLPSYFGSLVLPRSASSLIVGFRLYDQLSPRVSIFGSMLGSVSRYEYERLFLVKPIDWPTNQSIPLSSMEWKSNQISRLHLGAILEIGMNFFSRLELGLGLHITDEITSQNVYIAQGSLRTRLAYVIGRTRK